jgi:ribosomal 50S subunit-recycling heat shock protein
MRLDLFLKVSRIVPRRPLAQEFCSSGLVSVNGEVARSSRAVKVGDEIEIKKRGRIITLKVTKLPETKQLSKEKSVELYEILSEVEAGEELI